MITLCGFSVSNYYNKVKLALLEKGIPFQEELVMTGSSAETVLSATPLEDDAHGFFRLLRRQGSRAVHLHRNAP